MTTEKSGSGVDQEGSTTSSRETAGRELDALIAEQVFGADVGCIHQKAAYANLSGSNLIYCQSCGKTFGDTTFAMERARIRPYSTDIAAAFEVVEKMRERRIDFSLRFVSTWTADFDSVTMARTATADGETASEAICLAALRAVDAPSAVDPSWSTPERSGT